MEGRGDGEKTLGLVLQTVRFEKVLQEECFIISFKVSLIEHIVGEFRLNIKIGN